MEYKIIGNKAVIIKRTPEIISGDIIKLSFLGTPENCQAVITNKAKKKLYKLIENNACEIPVKFFNNNTVDVVLVFGDKQEQILCENIMVKNINEKSCFLLPDDNDLPEQFAKMAVELYETQVKLSDIDSKLTALTTKVTKLSDGYDLI